MKALGLPLCPSLFLHRPNCESVSFCHMFRFSEFFCRPEGGEVTMSKIKRDDDRQRREGK